MKSKDWKFFLKVIRNGAILSGLYFFSIFAATDTVGWVECKPVLIFLGTYILAELAQFYNLKFKGEKKLMPLIF